MYFRLFALLGAVATRSVVAADTAPMNRVVCAIEAPICARANVQRNETVIERSIKETRSVERLWSVPRWLNVVRVDESGDHLLVEATPFAMLPSDASPNFVVLQVFSRGKLRREITLEEVLPDLASQTTAMRLGAWGKGLGSAESGTARYLLASGQSLTINLATAKIQRE